MAAVNRAFLVAVAARTMQVRLADFDPHHASARMEESARRGRKKSERMVLIKLRIRPEEKSASRCALCAIACPSTRCPRGVVELYQREHGGGELTSTEHSDA
jgi:hypothetical protein